MLKSQDSCWHHFLTAPFPTPLDAGVGEALAIEIDTSLPAERVIRVLEQVATWRSPPQAIRLDNGPELIAERFMAWCAERGIELRYIQPGKPDQNAFIERFNCTYRTEVLNAYVFESLDQVREITAEWLQSYNEERPHDALAGLPPATYRANVIKPEVLRWQCRLDGGAYETRPFSSLTLSLLSIGSDTSIYPFRYAQC